MLIVFLYYHFDKEKKYLTNLYFNDSFDSGLKCAKPFHDLHIYFNLKLTLSIIKEF